MPFSNSEAALFELASAPENHIWRGRPCWASIDLNAIERNVQTMLRLIGPMVQLMAVVKANAYGHGLAGTAMTLFQAGASSFGVACVDEGAQLRSAGIDCPIIVLGYVPHWEAMRVLQLDLTVALTTKELAIALSSAAQTLQRSATVHIKVDTGMSRFGLLPGEVRAFLEYTRSVPGLHVEGIFTHLATADEDDKTFAREQLSIFDSLCCILDKEGTRPHIRHAVNSAGVIAFPEHHYEMVRTGVCLYGVPPADMPGLPELAPALSLKARVARIRKLPVATSVGYGSTYRTASDTDVALLPIGYADGFSRALSNIGQVLIHGRRASVIGRISMDQTTIDVTGLGPIQHDDEVTLIGRQCDDEITATEVGAWRGTIAYEVLTGLSVRIPRIYVRDGMPVAVAENGEFRKLDLASY